MSFTINRLPEPFSEATLSWGQLKTEYGVVWMVFSGKALCFLGFARDQSEDLWPLIERRIPRAGKVLSSGEMRERWAGIEDAWLNDKALPFELRVNASDFEHAVWETLQQIPLGKTFSYSWVAEQIGRPKAVRAVASAVGRNLFSVLIPCHRVVSKNGGLGGYAWGLSCKKALLRAEGVVLS